MTGLDLGADALVEVAAVVTDSDLNVLGEGVDVIVSPPAAALEQMGDFVREMHTSSGLLTELAAGATLAEAEAQVLAYLREWVPEAGRAPLAGNSIGTDKALPRPGHARAHGAPALPGHRRLVDQGARPTLVPAGLLRLPREGGWSPGAGRHPREHRRAAVLPRGAARAAAGPRLQGGQGHRGADRGDVGRPPRRVIDGGGSGTERRRPGARAVTADDLAAGTTGAAAPSSRAVDATRPARRCPRAAGPAARTPPRTRYTSRRPGVQTAGPWWL